MNKLKNIFLSDGYFGLIFLLLGITTQVIAYYSSEGSLLSLVSGISGIFAVVLCSQKQYIQYVFAWMQLITYVILAYQQRLYGEIYENMFYAATMLIGMYVWFRNCDKNSGEVKSERLSRQNMMTICLVCAIGIVVVYDMLLKTDDTQPFMDSISTVPAIIAQILMIMRYREQWIFWFIIDVTSIYMWFVADDYCMVMQYIFWTINCIYGYLKWSKS